MTYVPSTWNNSYSFQTLLPTVDITTGIDLLVRPGQRTLMIDYLDQSWNNLMNQIAAWNNDVWIGQKWTTMCYKWQNTTSLWMFNLQFNGLSNPLQLQSGMILRFPTIAEITRVVSARTAISNIGQVVTI